MNLRDFDLSQASKMYGIANTPLFLVRKLQGDPAVRAISESCPGKEIVEELRRVVQIEPINAVEAVWPYVLLVALSLKPGIDHLREVSGFESDIFRWYGYISQVLLETFSAVERSTVQVPGQVSSPSVSPNSDSPNTVQLINVA